MRVMVQPMGFTAFSTADMTMICLKTGKIELLQDKMIRSFIFRTTQLIAHRRLFSANKHD